MVKARILLLAKFTNSIVLVCHVSVATTTVGVGAVGGFTNPGGCCWVPNAGAVGFDAVGARIWGGTIAISAGALVGFGRALGAGIKT